MNSRGKRMVQEDELTYLQELKAAHSDPSAEWGGGETFTSGEGITIEDETISANIKAGYGIVVDVDETDESLVIMTDDEHIQDKLTAGTGISINSADNTISVDSTVAMVSDLSAYQTTSNLVTTMDSSSTDAQYPSAKCVYDIIGDVESLLSNI